MLTRSVTSIVAALSFAASPASATAPGFASYRAVYDLAIDDAGDQDGGATVSGRLAVEFTVSRCGGYRSKMRFVTEGEDGDVHDYRVLKIASIWSQCPPSCVAMCRAWLKTVWRRAVVRVTVTLPDGCRFESGGECLQGC